jgi:hypothetical protein
MCIPLHIILFEGMLKANQYFCEVRYLLHICLISVLFGASSRVKAANIVPVQSQEISCKDHKPVFPANAFSFSTEGNVQLYYSVRTTSPLKRHVGSGYLLPVYFPLYQTLLCLLIFTTQSRKNYIPHSLLHLFPKHNFW